jgi:hypothetical protein
MPDSLVQVLQRTCGADVGAVLLLMDHTLVPCVLYGGRDNTEIEGFRSHCKGENRW